MLEKSGVTKDSLYERLV